MAIDKQKVTDTFAALADSFAGMISSLGMSASMGFVVVGVIAVLIVIVVIMGLMSSLGGGSQKDD